MIKETKPIASIFIHCYPPARGGAEYLAEKYVEVLNKKYDVHVFTGMGETLDSYKTFTNYLPVETNKNIHRLSLKLQYQRFFNKFLSKIILKISFFSPFYFGPILDYKKSDIKIIAKSDVIFGIAMPTMSFYDAYKFSRKFNTKLVLVPTYHNVNYYNHCYFFQKAFNYANKILFLTPFEKIGLQKNYRINENKFVQTTFCPYTLDQINNLKSNKKITNQIKLGFIGQITLRKNLTIFKDFLDRYINYWQQHDYAISVYLSGARTNSSSQIEKIFKKYINNHIVKINYDFKESEKQKEFEKIDVFINPSEEESLGIVNFEAIFFGLPILIREKSAFASLTSNSNWFFNDVDQLQELLINIYTEPHALKLLCTSQSLLLKNYTYDKFDSTVLNLII